MRDTQIRRKVNTEKRKSPKTNAHADITEMKCLNGVPCSLSLFSACSLVWGVFTTKGLSLAMQLLDLHFSDDVQATLSTGISCLVLRCCAPVEKESSTKRSFMESNYCCGKFGGGVNNAPVRNIEATHGFTQFMSRWQISRIGE